MSITEKNNPTGMSPEERRQMLNKLLAEKKQAIAAGGLTNISHFSGNQEIKESAYNLAKLPGFTQLKLQQTLAGKAGISNPFFPLHEGLARDISRINGREFINFSTYNYVDLCGHPEVNEAAAAAIQRYGTSASASRVVSGDRPILRELERALADFIGVADCLVFVSGHATNVSTIGHLFGPKDLILHDGLAHNSMLVGAQLSRAHRVAFAHNSWQEADNYLTENRQKFDRVLIGIEGIYSMDGDMAPLPGFIEVKKKHKAILLVDEAHSLGVLGESGHGIAEQFHVDPKDVDLWMGTLSKTLAGAGGYIAGCAEVVEYLKFTCPGFVYSVGLSPVLAAASLKALEILGREPERTRKLHENGLHFLEKASSLGLDTGLSQGYGVVPLLIGSSVKSALLSNAMNRRGINVQPIIHPAVEERAARLRFFLSSAHSFSQIDTAIEAAAQEIARINKKFN